MGTPRISTALTNVNTVAFTPMPSARATAATSVNHLSFKSSRPANRTSSQRPMYASDTLTDRKFLRFHELRFHP